MFRNSYQPAFYKQLHRYVHKNYRKHIAFENLKQLFLHPLRWNYAGLKKAASAIYYIPATYIDKLRLIKLENISDEYAG
jgi:anaerobic magnesium-protoporphyrin IX monomethyl ester cyclase